MTTTPLCPTAKLIQTTLDGSSEAALLLTQDGAILHLNPSAENIFTSATPNVTDLLQFDQPWKDIVEGTQQQHQKEIKAHSLDASKSFAIDLTRLGGCPCCSVGFVCLYVEEPSHEAFLRIRDTVDASFDPMLTVDEQGMIVMVNDAAIRAFGYTYDEFVGNNISMLCGGGHAEHHDKYMQRYMKTGIQKIVGLKREVPARRKDGTEFPVELGVKEIHSGAHHKRYFCGFMKDLTAYKKHEEEMNMRESLSQGMINASFDPMVEIDEQGLIKVVNDAAVAMFGWTREEFIGSNISMICGGGHGPRHDGYIAHYLASGEKRVIGKKRQVKARRKDGSEFDVELGMQEVMLSSGKRAFCGFIRDLTQQKMDKRALRRSRALIQDKFFSGGDQGAES